MGDGQVAKESCFPPKRITSSFCGGVGWRGGPLFNSTPLMSLAVDQSPAPSPPIPCGLTAYCKFGTKPTLTDRLLEVSRALAWGYLQPGGTSRLMEASGSCALQNEFACLWGETCCAVLRGNGLKSLALLDILSKYYGHTQFDDVDVFFFQLVYRLYFSLYSTYLIW